MYTNASMVGIDVKESPLECQPQPEGELRVVSFGPGI